MGYGRGSYRVLVGIPAGKRPVGKPRHRLEDNIKKGSSRCGMKRAWTGFIWLRIGTGVGLL
jgi:hypothetical protein